MAGLVKCFSITWHSVKWNWVNCHVTKEILSFAESKETKLSRQLMQSDIRYDKYKQLGRSPSFFFEGSRDKNHVFSTKRLSRKRRIWKVLLVKLPQDLCDLFVEKLSQLIAIATNSNQLALDVFKNWNPNAITTNFFWGIEPK